MLTFFKSNQKELEKCVEKNFDSQYSFCRSCVIVDQHNLEDSNNCLCVQCAVKALSSQCHAMHCSDVPNTAAANEAELIKKILRGFDTDSTSHFEYDSTVADYEVSYFVDPASKVYRNLLADEKNALVHSIVEELKHESSSIDVNVEALGFIKKKAASTIPLTPAPNSPPTLTKNLPPLGAYPTSLHSLDFEHADHADDDTENDDNYDESDDAGDSDDADNGGEWKKPHFKSKPKGHPPLIYTKTKLYTTYTPKKKTLTKWNPKIISKTIVIDRCSDKRTVTTVVATATDTEHQTVYEPIYKLKTTTEYDTVWWGTTKTKVKHDVETLTETDYEVFTKTKYKNDIQTKTETEVEEITKYIKVGKVTKTDTETDWRVKWKIKTTTIGTPSTKISTATKTITKLSTITTHDKTRTKVRTKTFTRTKKIWNPRHTTTERLSITLGPLGVNEERQQADFGMYRVNDDPAPLLASKRVVKVRQGNNSNYSTSTIAIMSSSSSHPQTKITGSNTTIIGVSAASQATTAVIVYTTLAVSVATSMMLAFSYNTNLPLDSASEDSIEHSSSDDEDNDWSDADDLELTNDKIRPLNVQMPHSGHSPKEISKQYNGENSIGLMID